MRTVLRADNFAFVRTFAAALVLFAHQFELTGRPDEPVFLGVHSYGGLGVLIFFSLSGFLVTKSWVSDPNVWRFALRRLLRIWPAYAVLIFLTVMVLGPMLSALPPSGYYRNPWVIEYQKNLVFVMREGLPGVAFRGSALPTAVNGSLWTIPLELWCYVLLAAFGTIGLIRRGLVLAVLTLTLVLVHAGLPVRGEWFASAGLLPIHHLYFLEFGTFFLIGACLQHFWPFVSERLSHMAAGAAIVGMGAYLCGRPMLAAMIWVPFFTICVASGSYPYPESVASGARLIA